MLPRIGPVRRRCEQCITHAHASSTTMVERRAWDARIVNPIGKRLGHVADSCHDSSPLVSVLPRHGRPTNVAGFVVTVVVDPIDRQIGCWPPSHVGKKCLVGVAPTVAHPNAAPPVVMKSRMIRVAATRNHAAPHAVLRCRLPVACFPVSPGVGSQHNPEFATQATARLSSFVCKQFGQYRHFGAACAKASPVRALVIRWHSVENRQSSKCLALKIVQSHGRSIAQTER